LGSILNPATYYYDDLEERDIYDLVILCEVIEHMPVPLS
jgi:hypothetical protein